MFRYFRWSLPVFVLCNLGGLALVYQSFGIGLFSRFPALFALPAFAPHVGLLVLRGLHRVYLVRKISSALRKIGLRNMEKEYPSVRRLRIKPDRTFSFRLTRKSIPFKKFEDHGSGLESALLGTVISMENDVAGGFVDIVMSSGSQARQFPYPRDYLLPNFSFLVGQRYGRVITSDFRSSPHLLVAGETSSGKSTFIRQMIYTIYKNNEDSKFVLVDLKGGLEFQLFEKLPRVKVAPDLSRARALLNEIDEELSRRKLKFHGAGATDIDAYNTDFAEKRLSRHFVFVDELAEIFLPGLDQDKKMVKEIQVYLSRIARLGRAFGIHLVAATQRPDRHAIDGQIKSNLGAKICFKVSNDTSSQIVLDNPMAARIPAIPGRAIWSRGLDLLEVQTPFLSSDKCKRDLNRTKNAKLPLELRAQNDQIFSRRNQPDE